MLPLDFGLMILQLLEIIQNYILDGFNGEYIVELQGFIAEVNLVVHARTIPSQNPKVVHLIKNAIYMLLMINHLK